MDFYLYFKAIHIIAVISWMAGMLYLPRLFAYHCNKGNTKETNKIFVLMEKRLLRYIMNPAGILTWGFGLVLFFHPSANVDPFTFNAADIFISVGIFLIIIKEFFFQRKL